MLRAGVCAMALLGAAGLATNDTPTGTIRTATTAWKTPHPTRLLHGPIVFRVTDGGHSPNVPVYQEFFKLNRDPWDKSAVDGNVVFSPRGTYGLLTRHSETAFVDTYSKDSSGACFSAEFYAEDYDKSFFDELDRIHLGHRLKAYAQPLTPNPKGGVSILGRLYESKPIMRATDRLHQRAAVRRELKKIGCAKPNK